MKKNLTLAIVLAAFVFFLTIFFSVGPAYAIGPDKVDPGDPPNTVDGYVYYGPVIPKDPPVPGVTVRLYTSADPLVTQTNSYGTFSFQNYQISPNMGYLITVNGAKENLGVSTENAQWGQWAGTVYTDNNAYGSIAIEISRSAEVSVPTAALFSNTKYATLSYEMMGTYSVSHSMSFSVASPIGISVGYETSESVEIAYSFTTYPLTQSKIMKRHYAATYYSDGYMARWGIVSTGIAGADASWSWDILPTNEYLTTSTIPNHVEHRVGANSSLTAEYTETGSATWSFGNPLAIHYNAFGVTLNIDTTVTATTTNMVRYEINRYPDSNPEVLEFWAYSLGTVLAIPEVGIGVGGFELHVWDYSGAG